MQRYPNVKWTGGQVDRGTFVDILVIKNQKSLQLDFYKYFMCITNCIFTMTCCSALKGITVVQQSTHNNGQFH